MNLRFSTVAPSRLALSRGFLSGTNSPGRPGFHRQAFYQLNWFIGFRCKGITVLSRLSGSEPCVQVGQKYAGIHIENMDNVSMDSKQACPKHWLSRKVHHPGPLINATSQKQRYSIAFLISTIRNFVITWLNKGATTNQPVWLISGSF